MTSDRLFRENVKGLRTLLPEYTDLKDGETGILDANSHVIADAAVGLPAPYTHVRLNGSRSATRCVNLIMDRHAAGFTVLTGINERTGEREVMRILASSLYTLTEDVVNRGRQPGGGVVNATLMLDGRIEPAPDISATTIRARSFQWALGAFPAQPQYALYDLADDIAGITASVTAPASVYADPADGQVHAVMGTEHGLAYPYSQADFDAIPLPYAAYPLAGLVLSASQTDAADSFTPLVRYWERRIFLDANGIDTPGWLVRTDTTIPTGAIMTQPGSVRVTASLTINGEFYQI